jgi:methionine synthase I (cobalamin-dependent)
VPGWEGFFIGGALANARAPDVVRRLHSDYLAAGADVVTTNNFVVTPHHLAKAFGSGTPEAQAALEELTQARREGS